jgi:cytochrome P450
VQDAMNLSERPAHVPETLVVDFDIYSLANAGGDLHATLSEVQQSHPGIFWTPRSGGHWVVTRADDIEAIQRDYRRFSNRRITVPPAPPQVPLAIPLELDPPRHSAYRRPLMTALQPSEVRGLADKVKDIAIEAIEAFQARGHCEFVSEFAQILPIHIFLDLVDLPRSDKDTLLPIVNRALRAPEFADRMQGHMLIDDYLRDVVRARRAEPGDDLISKVVNVPIDGEKIAEDEALRFANLLLFGGLDTVAAMLSFVVLFLARNPNDRKVLCTRLDDEKYLDGVVEELLRRHGVAMTSRIVAEDTEYSGVNLREGDVIMPATPFVGLDSTRFANPLTVDFERKGAAHGTFGNGPHACPGAALARREVKVFLQQWLSRIPDFKIADERTVALESGLVLGVKSLELVWPG